jgi:hypothetical protein
MPLHKPQRWAFQKGLVAPRAQGLWPGCCLALPFWDGGRICEDLSGHNLHAVFGSALDPVGDWLVSTYGSCLDFDGAANQELTIAAPPAAWVDGQPRMSWEIIFRCDNPVAGSGIIQGLLGKYTTTDGRRAWRIYVNGDEVALQVSSDGVANEIQLTTNCNLNNGVWAHVVLTYDAGVFRAYKDGLALTTDGDFGAQLSIFAGTIEPIRIGARSDSNRLAGMIAGIRIWRNRVLGAAEVLQLYTDPWRMYEATWMLPTFAVEHSGGAAAGTWFKAADVAAGLEGYTITGLSNGVSYDVQLKSVDTSDNISAGTTPVAGTPAVGSTATRLRSVLTPRVTGSRPSGALAARTRR